MNSKAPKFSILTPSYNHEKYIKYFIESVLNQTEQDFELIIVDDNSSDKNVEEIKKFNDDRIILIQHEYNKGINAGLNSAFARARGKYVVFMASDDAFEKNHLETTSKYLDEHPETDVFYCSLSLIDEKNNEIVEVPDYYKLKQISKYEILKKMFIQSNSLLSPGMTMRREAFAKLYPLDLSIIQLQDYNMHISLLLNGEAHLSEQQLVKYRQISSATNISAKSSAVMVREGLEEELLMDSFLHMDIETLKMIFGSEIKDIGEPTNETIPYFLGRMALKSKKLPKQAWGYRVIMNFIKSEANFKLLHDLYGFDFKQYIGLSGNFKMVSNDLISVFEYKISKYKKLFNIFLIVSIASLLIALGLFLGYFIK